jgi:putative ABC transport system ATP-binding protein
VLGELNDDGLTQVRQDKIGFIFQFFNLLPSPTCLENVAQPLDPRGWPRRQDQERARELLNLVQLGPRIEHLPDELSVCPPILLADEPTGNLDSQTGCEILNLIRDLHVRLQTRF